MTTKQAPAKPVFAGYRNNRAVKGHRSRGTSGYSKYGDPSSQLPGIMRAVGHAPVTQFRDDIFDRPLTDEYLSDGAWITYGALAGAVPILRPFLAQFPDASRNWSE